MPIRGESSSTPASFSSSVASSYARIRAVLGGNRAVFLGDSIMVSSETVAGQRAISIPVYASITSYQRLNYVRNAGVAGNTSGDMLDRFDDDVTPYSPSVVVILAGTNDSNDSEAVALSDYAANIEALVLKCRQISARPILCTVPPNDTGAARKGRISSYNAWLARYCQTEGILLVDFFSTLVDESNGNYLSGYYNDGTHPNNAGYSTLGRQLGAAAYAALPNTSPILCCDNVDPNNLITNGLFLNQTGSGTTLRPTSWSISGTDHKTGITADFVTNDTAIQGSWFRQVSTTHSGTNTVFQTISSGIVPGNVYSFSGRVKATSLAGGATVTARILFNATANTAGYDWRALGTLGYDIADGIFHVEATAPSDASSVQVNLQFNAGSGTYQLAQLGLYDLTDLGIV